MVLYPGLNVALIVLLFVINTLACAALWRLRQERSVDIRCVPAMISCAALSFLSAFTENLRNIFSDEANAGGFCWVFRLKFVFEHQNITTMLFAAYRLIFFMELQDHLARTRDSQNRVNLLAGRGGWYVTHRHWMDWKRSRWVFLSQGGLMLIIVLSLATVDNGCVPFSVFRILGPVTAAVYLILILYAGCRLSRKGRDAGGFKIDLGWLALIGAILKSVNYALFFKFGESNPLQNLIESVIQFGISLTVCVFLVIAPVARLWFANRHKEFAEPTTLEALLKSGSGYESFQEFLSSEFASESLHFWNTVNLYRERFLKYPDAQTQLTDANDIVDTFVREGAVLEINITSATRTTIFETLASCQIKAETEGTEVVELVNLFDDAQLEIMKMMSRDSFRRYMKSRQYEAWKARALSTKHSRTHSRSGSFVEGSEHGAEKGGGSKAGFQRLSAFKSSPFSDSSSLPRDTPTASTRTKELTFVEPASPLARGASVSCVASSIPKELTFIEPATPIARGASESSVAPSIPKDLTEPPTPIALGASSESSIPIIEPATPIARSTSIASSIPERDDDQSVVDGSRDVTLEVCEKRLDPQSVEVVLQPNEVSGQLKGESGSTDTTSQ